LNKQNKAVGLKSQPPCFACTSLHFRNYQWVDLFAADGMEKLMKSLNLRASQVKAQPVSLDGSSPVIKKTEPKKQTRPRQASSNTTINIHGGVTGSNIVIGNDNDVNNK
jgi:hypothetical protein